MIIALSFILLINKQKSESKTFGFLGGEGEIRTLEPFYRLHDFQSCALDQLGDFSIFFCAVLFDGFIILSYNKTFVNRFSKVF